MSNNDLKVSQYQRIVNAIKADIRAGVLTPGDRLPAIATLCKTYNVSSNTIIAALRCLGDDGFVKSKRGSGVYVQERKTPLDRSKSNKTIAVVLACPAPYNVLPFEGAMVKGVIDQCQRDNYHAIVTDSHKDLETEKELLLRLASEVAGLIIMPTAHGVNYEAYRELREKEVPFVFIDRAEAGIKAPAVTTDNKQVGYLATKHLIETGCERICVISGEHSLSSQERLNGYLQALEEFGIEFDPSQMHYSMPAKEEMQAILLENTRKSGEIATAGQVSSFGIFALNEDIANDCYHAITPLGLKIPGDVAVVGVNDMHASFFQPKLSTVRQEPYKMGEYAVQILMRILSGSAPEKPEQIRIKPELIVRDSTNPLASLASRKIELPLSKSKNAASERVVLGESGTLPL